MGGNVFNGIRDTGHLVGFLIGNFNGEFVLNSHDNFHDIQTIQSQVVGKLDGGIDLGRINLIKVFDDGNNAIQDFGGVQKGLFVVSSTDCVGYE